MIAKITKTSNRFTNWVEGKVGPYCFEAKVYDTGSKYGINNGRISKLAIWNQAVREQKQNFDEACIIQYDRNDWGIEPNQETQPYLDAILKLFSD